MTDVLGVFGLGMMGVFPVGTGMWLALWAGCCVDLFFGLFEGSG